MTREELIEVIVEATKKETNVAQDTHAFLGKKNERSIKRKYAPRGTHKIVRDIEKQYAAAIKAERNK